MGVSEDVQKKGKEYVHRTSGDAIKVGPEKMSKSKKNVVDPAYIIEEYGADVARLL